MARSRSERRQLRELRQLREIQRMERDFAKGPPGVLGFTGVMDGAPDDQLQDCRGPEAWHVLAIVLAPNPHALDAFCEKIARHSGWPKFTMRKWGEAENPQRGAYRRAFIQGFIKAVVEDEVVHVSAYVSQAKKIRAMWEHGYSDLQGWTQAVQLTDGKPRTRFGPFVMRRGGQLTTCDVTMVDARAAVIAWQSCMLAHLYGMACRLTRERPYWQIYCDRLPGDANGNALAVLARMLYGVVSERLFLHLPEKHLPRDSNRDLLADCIAGWVRNSLQYPTGLDAIALRRARENPDVARSFHIHDLPIPTK